MVTSNTAADLLRGFSASARGKEAVRRATLTEQRQFQLRTEGSQCPD